VLKKPGSYRLEKNHEMQGAQILRNKVYPEYVVVTKYKSRRSMGPYYIKIENR